MPCGSAFPPADRVVQDTDSASAHRCRRKDVETSLRRWRDNHPLGRSRDDFFLVSDGKVNVIRADREIARLGPGDFFGEVSLIGGEPRNALSSAQTAVDTYVLGRTDFDAALAASQSFRDQLYRF
jgi:CRP-like cAMP-binding protein